MKAAARARLVIGATALIVATVAGPCPALAGGVVGTGTPSSCTDAALNAALTGGGVVTFNCGPAPVTIDISSAGGGTGTKMISTDTTIDGGSMITISGGNSVGVFASAAVTFTVQNLSIVNGKSAAGGGIVTTGSGGTLIVTNSTFSSNSADSFGGGIFNGSTGTVTVINGTFSGNSAGDGGGIAQGAGMLTITNSTFSGNSAHFGVSGTAEGGGIFNAGGTVTVTNSTFFNNSVDNGGCGGGIISGSVGTLTVSNSTFSSNSAGSAGRGGGLENSSLGTLTVRNSTFSSNSAGTGGGIAQFGNIGVLVNTIVANNPSGGNCAGFGVTDGGHNLDDGATCGFTGTGCATTTGSSFCSTNPQLDPAGLASNGGPTQTIALQSGSPAIDSGDDAVCAAPPVNTLDQRGFTRPGAGATNCSIGAYEYNSSQPLVWNLAADFRFAPDQENPSRDTYGNLGVWHYLESSTLVRDPSTYTLLPSFVMDLRLSSLVGGWCDPTSPSQVLCIQINASGSDQQIGSFVFPAGAVDVHPLNDRLVIVGWRSPIAGRVTVTGGVTDLDSGGGNGIAWFIAQGAADVASGVIDNGGAESFADGFNPAGLGAVAVTPGDFLYFIVDPRDGNFFNDSTRLDVTITQVPATSLVVSGTCMQPGTGLHGLTACTAGTVITAYLCTDQSCAASTLSTLEVTQTDANGQFSFVLDGGQVAGKRLVFDATIVQAARAAFARGTAGTLVDYQIIDFGPAENVTTLNVLIDPVSEAAVRLVGETGAQHYTDQGIKDAVQAVRTADKDIDFGGVSAADAATLATETARIDPMVQTALTVQFCTGDCDTDHAVKPNELLTIMNIALGNADVADCSVGDGNNDRKITVDEIVTAVNNAVSGACSQ